MDTISNHVAGERPRRRFRSDEFKADAVAACSQPGVSMAAVALARGINANLLRCWVREAEQRPVRVRVLPAQREPTPPTPASFVPLQLPDPVAKDIRVEVRHGATTVLVTWPAEAASQCTLRIKELLR